MTELQFCYEVSLDFSSPVHDHAFVLRCLPHDMPEQILLWSELIIQPEPHRISFGGDAFGTRLITGFLPEQHDSFRYSVEGRARRDDSERLHFQTPLTCYRYPSGMTQPSPEMARFLADCNIDFHGCTLEAAEELSEAVHEYFEYVPGVTGTATTAAESFAMRQGVCQDYAQCYIALARMAGYSARYVCGLPEGEGQSHAWAEVCIDGVWEGMDPTRNCRAGETYLKLAVGRDFLDCPVERGVFYGAVDQCQTAFMRVTSDQ